MQAKKDPLKEGQWVEERGYGYYCYIILNGDGVDFFKDKRRKK